MLTMTWKLGTNPDGRRNLRATWTPVVVPGSRESTQEEREVPVLRAS
jgi:hypothetical protein